MPTQLTDLEVEWVSLVDTAAVRDPENPEEPQRFILCKAEAERDDADPNEEGRGPVDLSELRERIEALETRAAATTTEGTTMRKSDTDESDAVAASTREGMNVSPGARAAIARAIAHLQPHVGEDPRIEALANKLTAIHDPTQMRKSNRRAEDLARVIKAEWDVVRQDGPMLLQDREQNRTATRDAQLAYLREMSPAAAAAWERHAGLAGR